MSSRHGKPWTWEEVLAAFNFYCREDFGRLHRLNPEIIRLAERLGRTPDSVMMFLSDQEFLECHNLKIFQAN